MSEEQIDQVYEIELSNGKIFHFEESNKGGLELRVDSNPHELQIKPICSNVIEII